MDHVAVVGYSLLLVFALYKLGDTLSRPVDLVANIALITGLGALIAYHVQKIRTGKDETSDATQKKLRLAAHSTLVAFLLLTLTFLSAAKFRFYDWFALLGHGSLFVAVWKNLSQLLGVGLLALYFLFATGRKFTARGMELLNLIGRALLTLFFVAAFVQGVRA